MKDNKTKRVTFRVTEEEYKKLDKILAPLQNQAISNHEILQERVVCVTYEGGTQIYLNSNNYAVTVEGNEIPAMGYHVA